MRSWVFAFAAAALVLFLTFSSTQVEAKKASLVPIYQWWHPTLKNYYYGTDAEATAVEARGYVSQKFSFYVYSARVKDSYPLYRFTNDRDVFVSLYKENMKDLNMKLDKVLGYTYVKKQGNDKKKTTDPVYAYYTGNGTSYYWTSNKQAGDASGYKFEYLAFYSAGTTPESVESSIRNNFIVQAALPTTTPSRSATPSKSHSPSKSLTRSRTVTATPTKTPTRTPTSSKTPAASKTPSHTVTRSVSRSAKASSSRTPTPSRTPSNTHTRPASVTPTRTVTPTASISHTKSRTPSSSRTPAASTTPSRTPVASKSVGALPLTFNALDRWNLRGLGILNQGSCGSCYSFSAATVVSYRNMIGGYSITTNGIASPQSILNCGTGIAYGSAPCNGGYPYSAIGMAQTGLGTCSAGDCKAGCIPYCEPSCGVNTATCRNHCPAGGTGALVYSSEPTVLHNSSRNPDGIKKELMANGPTTAVFSVYKSWESFVSANKTGVFEAANLDTSVYLGGHAVVLVGWGRDLSGDYWIFQNSWGSYWGDSGFFYVRAGLDLMGIEEELYGAKYSATPTAKQRIAKRDVATLPATGVPVALDPAAPEVQSLGTFVGQQFAATSSSGFEFAAMQTATSQVVAGTSFQVTIAGADGTLVSATVLSSAVPEAAPELVSSAVVGKATPLSNGPATQGNPASLGGASGGGGGGGNAAAGGNGGGGGGGGGGGEAGAATAGGLSGGAIAGAVVGSVLGAVLILGVVAGAGFVAYKKFRSDKYDNQPKQPAAAVVSSTTTPELEKSKVTAFLERNHTAVDLSPKVDDNFRASITARNPNITDI